MLTKKLTTAIVTFTTIFTMAGTPVFASTQVGQLGNGAFSNNNATVTKTNTNTAAQTNSANISNNVTTSSNTGGNHADFNTGGSATIETGPAVNNTTIKNAANKNVLIGDPNCGCDNGTTVLQADNGAFSDNNANVSAKNNNKLSQSNAATISNTVKSTSDTGDNTANFGTNGDQTIITGGAKNNTGIWNAANANIAVAGSSNGDPNSHGTDLRQVGNGAFSNSTIDVTKQNSNSVEQTNAAEISNNVTSNAESGDNAADFTTGGSSTISTGSTWNTTALVNHANKNVVAGFGNCNCDDFTFLKEGDNGAFSQNDITTTLSNNNSLKSSNAASVGNKVKSDGNSGDNSASFSTGDPFGAVDPTVLTGGTFTNTGVDTAVNENIAAGSNNVTLGGWDVNWTWTNPFDWMTQ